MSDLLSAGNKKSRPMAAENFARATDAFESGSGEIVICAIELLEASLKQPANPEEPINKFNFDVNIEIKSDLSNGKSYVITRIEVKDSSAQNVIGSLKVSCIYDVLNFAENIRMGGDGEAVINPALAAALTSLSVSTTRGVMFSVFKGTFLHNAILPVI